ncbi:glycosyltransferase [Tropicimonas isoalkanivorans]|uniref:Glycosyltransferase involved in cell wall bisynthesis n=1 Tax=Tropicimonas isoalkanivorans TaxID=441112 RepID=A0A1I1E813_9RHOB|nr:glycosyltransferase [Tropicimonas isoalkanivorans]SFB81110.1 Glycosyltransferase involved in cell wall bisynthesis [Tropicimonas isoalkanivorans]
MRSCIATGDYYRPGETFINRHIQHLFGGETCVVTGRYHGENPLGRPVFERRKRTGAADRLIAPYWLLHNTWVHGTSRLPFGRAKAELAQFWRDNGVEVILAEFGTQALAVAPLGNEMGIPVFTYFRGTDASKHLRRPHIQKAYRKLMPKLAGVFSVSQFLLDNLAAHGITHSNAHVIPSGVNVDLFRPAEKTPASFLAVGRFVEKKAPEITLRSFAKGTAAHPEARLEMVGDGPLLDPCKALATELGIADRVSFPGLQPHDDVRERLARSAVFLQHSITAADGNTEGLPTAIQEALACGCITLSTRHAGIPEAVEHGVNGFLVDEWDEAGFTAQIARVLDEGRQAEMEHAARATAEARFDNERLLEKLERTILDTLDAS